MFFTVIDRFGSYPENSKSQVFLTWDDWNDFSFETVFGIFYIEERPTYEEAMAFQLTEAKKVRGDGDLDALLRGKENWVIN